VSQDAALTIHLRAEIEEFLYMEAELLDEWRLDEWLELFEEGAISQSCLSVIRHWEPMTAFISSMMIMFASNRAFSSC
jgi:hypothetical protein